MASYQIVCTDQVPVSEPTAHAHIVAVGVDTDDDGYANIKQSKQDVISGISNNDSYYTIGNITGKKAYVEVVSCIHCGQKIIKTYPDDTRDNNLDSLRRCSWSK